MNFSLKNYSLTTAVLTGNTSLVSYDTNGINVLVNS